MIFKPLFFNVVCVVFVLLFLALFNILLSFIFYHPFSCFF
ncbi:hypothetical protein CoNPh11_CDS0008 [Staphylococcus phage S-CoN_Ph11]|nr:hypothetical protein CoNPh11_CDS0008 [Staphylococcus phage S-CoN_Ph11]